MSAASCSSAAAPAAPVRQVNLPSLFTCGSPDPLSVVLALCLSDLPAALGQPYFPAELIRIVHECACEVSFVVQFDAPLDSLPPMFQCRVSVGSTVEFVQWLGRMLPLALHPFAVADGGILGAENSSVFVAHCNCCLMDEEIAHRYSSDISRLLRAQLEPNEYRACYLEIEPAEDGQPFNTQYTHKAVELEQHRLFCLDELNQRKAAIVARGQEPVSVGLSELLERVRASLEFGVLPRGLSPRPCDWGQLFGWIRSFEIALNNRRRKTWAEIADDDDEEEEDDDGSAAVCPAEPLLSSILLQSPPAIEGATISHQTEARLWSCDPTKRSWFRAADSMMISDSEEDATDQRFDDSSSSASAAAASSVPSSKLRSS